MLRNIHPDVGVGYFDSCRVFVYYDAVNYLCPICQKMKPAKHFSCRSGAKGGKAKTDAKAEAARANGAKGGRPKKPPGKVIDAQFAKPTKKAK